MNWTKFEFFCFSFVCDTKPHTNQWNFTKTKLLTRLQKTTNATPNHTTTILYFIMQFTIYRFVWHNIISWTFYQHTDSSFSPTFRSFVPPVRDEESETQRKAHAKRVRETRRSTQGVTLDEIKSAEELVKKKNMNNNNNDVSIKQHLHYNFVGFFDKKF